MKNILILGIIAIYMMGCVTTQTSTSNTWNNSLYGLLTVKNNTRKSLIVTLEPKQTWWYRQCNPGNNWNRKNFSVNTQETKTFRIPAGTYYYRTIPTSNNKIPNLVIIKENQSIVYTYSIIE